MRTPSLIRYTASCLFALSLTACGGGGGGGAAPGPADFLVTPTAVLVVQNLNDDGPGSLRQTVLDAPPGSWIHFDPALPAGPVNLLSEIEIEKSVAIGGLSGAGQRFELNGGGNTRIFAVRPGVIFQLTDFSITQGGGVVGGAIYANECTILIWRTQFSGNSGLPGGGGAIYITDSMLRIFDSSFVANSGDYGGAISTLMTDLRIERTSFFLNTATVGHGGAIRASSGKVDIVNSSFLQNMAAAAGGRGGAISAASSGFGEMDLDVYNSTFTDNEADAYGGAIAIVSGGGQPAWFQLVRSIVAENQASSSPEMVAVNADAHMTGSWNWIGNGDGTVFTDGVHANHVGDAIAPLDPMLSNAVADPSGRMMRIPHELSPVVAAIPAGNAKNPEGAPLLLDQRGNYRDPAFASDIGAIER